MYHVLIMFFRLVVGLERKIYIFDLHSMQTLETLDISPNPKALCVLSCNGLMAFPSGGNAGEVLIYDTMNLNVLSAIQVHKADVVALAFNSDNTLLASASETGTIIRVFGVPAGKKKAVFRRGALPATIYCLAFNSASTILCASSDSGTIHLFSMTGAESSVTGSFGQLSTENSIFASATTGSDDNGSSNSTISQYLPDTSALSNIVEGTRDFAYARLRNSGVANLCAVHGPTENVVQVLVATIDGYFYQYSLDITVGGECRLERVCETHERDKHNLFVGKCITRYNVGGNSSVVFRKFLGSGCLLNFLSDFLSPFVITGFLSSMGSCYVVILSLTLLIIIII